MIELIFLIQKVLIDLSMSFLIKDDQLSGKYTKIYDKISNSIKKTFGNESVHNEKYLKTKTNLMKVKSIHIFMMMECHKQVSIVFVSQ